MSEILLGEHLEQAAQSPEPSGIVLLVQGGGMRGAYSIGGLATMEEVCQEDGTDLRDSFDAGIGSSAGLMNMVHWVAGHAVEGINVYADDLTNGRFMPRLQPFELGTARRDIGHVIRNDYKLADLDYLTDYALQRQGRIEEFGGRIADHVYAVVTDAETGLPRLPTLTPDLERPSQKP